MLVIRYSPLWYVYFVLLYITRQDFTDSQLGSFGYAIVRKTSETAANVHKRVIN